VRRPDGETDATRYAVSPDVAFAALEDGAVVLNLRTKRYYSLNETGAFIWGMLEARATVGEIVHRLIETYDVTAEEARASLRELVRELGEEQLVTPMRTGDA
jgi:hypothetical protein